MSVSDKKPFEERGPDDLSYWDPAQQLVDQIWNDGCGQITPLLTMLAYIKRRIPDDDTSDLYQAIQNLTASAYRHSDVFYEHAEQYADSLLPKPSLSVAAPVETTPVDRFQKLTDTLADLIEDPSLPDAMRELLGAAVIEAVNIHGGHITSGRDTATFVRGFFARACEKAAAAEAPAEAPKSTRRRN